ncbi:MAG: hypothetical protein ACFFE5_06825, partial [Candidatus Thorarchaeota archaeon]
MNYKNLKLKIVLFLGLLIFIIPQVKANPIPNYRNYNPIFMAFYMPSLFIATFFIELAIIKLFLGANKPLINPRNFYKTIFAVNIFTFPLTQIFAYVMYQYFLVGSDLNLLVFFTILIEILPISLECALYLKIFNKLNELNYFEHRVSNKMVLKSTITANLVSF